LIIFSIINVTDGQDKCEWVNVSSETVSPRSFPTKGVKW